MASLKLKRPENVPGNFFVDSTCIDCGTCFWVAPETFEEQGGMSMVKKQPGDLQAAYRALYSCPTNSIGVEKRDEIAKEVVRNFPYLLEGDVYHCGFHDENSFGAASYFIKNPNGNILIDSPRFLKQLADQMQKMGGVKYQLLTHKDDVAATDDYWKLFQSERMIHVDDDTSRTRHYESFFKGQDVFELTPELKVIPVPGHTKGSVCFLYQEKYLFTGDHLAYSPELGHLYAFKNACWYDFKIQTESMKRLLDFNIEYVLPGHDAPFKDTSSEVRASLEKCIRWMQSKM